MIWPTLLVRPLLWGTRFSVSDDLLGLFPFFVWVIGVGDCWDPSSRLLSLWLHEGENGCESVSLFLLPWLEAEDKREGWDTESNKRESGEVATMFGELTGARDRVLWRDGVSVEAGGRRKEVEDDECVADMIEGEGIRIRTRIEG